MEILGIGPSELLFILLIAIIVLGPKDMQKTGRAIGRWLNQLVRSSEWKAIQKTSQEISNLPTRLMREANFDEYKQASGLNQSPEHPQADPPGIEPGNSIQPPAAAPDKDEGKHA